MLIANVCTSYLNLVTGQTDLVGPEAAGVRLGVLKFARDSPKVPLECPLFCIAITKAVPWIGAFMLDNILSWVARSTT